MNAETLLRSKLNTELAMKNNSDFTFNKILEAMEEYASLQVAQANTRSTMLLKEVRKRLLFDVDDNGHPKSTMTDLMNMWDNVNAQLESPPTE